MSITISTLDDKIKLLQQQRDHTIVALNQVIGAIALCEQIKQEEVEAAAKEEAARKQMEEEHPT